MLKQNYTKLKASPEVLNYHPQVESSCDNLEFYTNLHQKLFFLLLFPIFKVTKSPFICMVVFTIHSYTFYSMKCFMDLLIERSAICKRKKPFVTCTLDPTPQNKKSYTASSDPIEVSNSIQWEQIVDMTQF